MINPLIKKARRFFRAVGFKKIDRLNLHVNGVCNFSCLYCYKQEVSNPKKCLTFEEQKSVIKKANDLGAEFVGIAGKEPLLYNKILDLISYIRHLGMNIGLYTNGSRLDSSTVKFLYDSKVQLHFKLDSLNKGVYEKITNRKGAHKWVIHKYNEGNKAVSKRIPYAVKLLINNGFDNSTDFPSLVIETCVNRLNYETIPELAQFCKSNRLKIRLERLITLGNALENIELLRLNEAESKALFSRLKSILGNSFINQHKSTVCSSRDNPVIMEDGSLGFCTVEKAGHEYGNVRNKPLKDLFKKINKTTMKKGIVLKDNFRICPGRLKAIS